MGGQKKSKAAERSPLQELASSPILSKSNYSVVEASKLCGLDLNNFLIVVAQAQVPLQAAFRENPSWLSSDDFTDPYSSPILGFSLPPAIAAAALKEKKTHVDLEYDETPPAEDVDWPVRRTKAFPLSELIISQLNLSFILRSLPENTKPLRASFTSASDKYQKVKLGDEELALRGPSLPKIAKVLHKKAEISDEWHDIADVMTEAGLNGEFRDIVRNRPEAIKLIARNPLNTRQIRLNIFS